MDKKIGPSSQSHSAKQELQPLLGMIMFNVGKVMLELLFHCALAG